MRLRNPREKGLSQVTDLRTRTRLAASAVISLNNRVLTQDYDIGIAITLRRTHRIIPTLSKTLVFSKRRNRLRESAIPLPDQMAGIWQKLLGETR